MAKAVKRGSKTKSSSSAPRSIRLKPGTEDLVKKWLSKNPISWAELLNAALISYITKPHTLEPISAEEADRAFKLAMKEHRQTIDALK